MIGDIVSGGYGALTRNSSGSVTSRVPLAGRGAFKIAENESPRPVDRVFLSYNHYNDVNGFGGPGGNLNRGVFGFEKTFLEGNASIGVRMPFLQTEGFGSGGLDGFGDLTVILKYAFLNDCNTGNVFSGGVAVTAPTGISPALYNGDRYDATLIQPWLGFIFNADRLYVHGFTSYVHSTDSADVNLYTADVGVGFRLYQGCEDAILTSIIPTVEAHANIPLDGSDRYTSTIYFPDSIVLTGGVHIGLCNRSFLTLGAGLPITGPRPYGAEYLAQYNLRF